MCVGLYEPVGGNGCVYKFSLLVFLYVCYVYNLSHWLYIYILVFCDDPFFHLRAHPTQVRVLGQMR